MHAPTQPAHLSKQVPDEISLLPCTPLANALQSFLKVHAISAVFYPSRVLLCRCQCAAGLFASVNELSSSLNNLCPTFYEQISLKQVEF